MPAIVIPFPRVRNRAWIMRHARSMASARSSIEAERHLKNRLGIEAASMTKKGLPPDVINAELAAIECAIRAALWRAVLTPGGAA